MTLRILIVLLVLPISGRAQSVCVYEVDSTFEPAGVYPGPGASAYVTQHDHWRVDTTAHWILLTDELRAAVKKWLFSNEITQHCPQQILSAPMADFVCDTLPTGSTLPAPLWDTGFTTPINTRVDSVKIGPPPGGVWITDSCPDRIPGCLVAHEHWADKVDTVRIVDTVFMCPCGAVRMRKEK